MASICQYLFLKDIYCKKAKRIFWFLVRMIVNIIRRDGWTTELTIIASNELFQKMY